MKRPGLKEYIIKITCNGSDSIDERIDQVFYIRQENTPMDEKEALRQDVVYFLPLIEMIQKEDDKHEHDRSLLQLLAMLAETYVKLEDYRPLGEVAHDVIEVLRDGQTSSEELQETVPRIVDAIRHSVYRHYLYEILLLYIKNVLYSDPEADVSTKLLTLYLKLHILLDDHSWTDRLITKDFKLGFLRRFSSSELLNIILHPQIDYLAVDPVEYTWEWEKIYYDIEDELDRRLAKVPRRMGFCFRYWDEKRNLLKEKYNIDWHAPNQMNPHVMFD